MLPRAAPDRRTSLHAVHIIAKERPRSTPILVSPNRRVSLRLWLLSALSGSAWGLLASYLLTDGRMGSGAWAIVAASLPIGIVMGLAARRFNHLPIIVRCLYALVSLYAAVGLLGMTLGVLTAIRGVDPSAFWIFGHPPTWRETVAWSVWFLVWGLSFSGYFAVLWPLAFMNHLLIWRWTNPRDLTKIQSLGLTGAGADAAFRQS